MIGDGENGATRYGVLIHTQCLRIFPVKWRDEGSEPLNLEDGRRNVPGMENPIQLCWMKNLKHFLFSSMQPPTWSTNGTGDPVTFKIFLIECAIWSFESYEGVASVFPGCTRPVDWLVSCKPTDRQGHQRFVRFASAGNCRPAALHRSDRKVC